jgi:hypothetical protein
VGISSQPEIVAVEIRDQANRAPLPSLRVATGVLAHAWLWPLMKKVFFAIVATNRYNNIAEIGVMSKNIVIESCALLYRKTMKEMVVCSNLCIRVAEIR